MDNRDKLPYMAHPLIFNDLVSLYSSLRYDHFNKEFLSLAMLLIYLFGYLRHFQHCTGHIMMGRFVGRVHTVGQGSLL